MTRTGNTLFELLAQAMGEEAIDERLFLFETLDYTTDADRMLEMLTRVVADRALGKVFFKDYYLMDVELFSSAVQDAITAEAAKSGQQPVLPGLAPFHTHAWPWNRDRRLAPGRRPWRWRCGDHSRGWAGATMSPKRSRAGTAAMLMGFRRYRRPAFPG